MKKINREIRFYTLELKCFILIVIGYAIYPLLKAILHHKKTWIIGENFGEPLKDNGYCFFKFCHDNMIEQDVFFISKDQFIAGDNFLESNTNVLKYGSVKHIFYLIISDVILHSHTHRDAIFHKLFPLIKPGKKIVFLQHGVTGFKKFDNHYKKFANEPDIIIVVSNFEKSIMLNKVGIKEQKLQITGFPRYDYLKDTSNINIKKQIAYIPTWRDWEKEEKFKDRVFFKKTSSLIKNTHFQDALEKNNIILKFYLHKNMKNYIDFFQSSHKNITIVKFGEESVQEMLKNSHILITDYSSVSWDFYYIKKPVIFYQFDVDEYLNKRGSYLDFECDSIGDITYSESELIDHISYYIHNNFQEKNIFKGKRDKYFNHSDKNNCKRLYQAILEL